METENTAPRKKADWVQIESQYRAGILSNRQIAAIHGISESAIRKKATTQGWVRDLSEDIRQKTEEKVRRAEVRNQVRSEEQIESDVRTVEICADSAANVVLRQRSDIARARALFGALMSELETETLQPELLIQLQQAASGSLDELKLHNLFFKVISLPSRIEGFRKLSEAFKVLFELETRAHRIKENEPFNPVQQGGPVQVMSAIEAYTKMCADSSAVD